MQEKIDKTNFTGTFLPLLLKKTSRYTGRFLFLRVNPYFLRYITSFTSLTVRGMSGK
jgi:hypothetical protein